MLNGTLNKLKVAAIAVITLVFVVVVLQNTQAVDTKFLLLTVTMPIAALLFGSLSVGFAVGVLTAGHIVSSAKWMLPNIRPKGATHARTESEKT